MTPPLKFDEPALVARLENLSKQGRVAFATACAGRLRDIYAKFSDLTGRRNKDAFDRILNRIWNDLTGEPMSQPEADALLEACMALIPADDKSSWVTEQAAAEDGAAALAYALRCHRNGAATESAWAARRAYEATDTYVIIHENIDTNAPRAEAQVLAHPLVQAELVRQQRDLDALIEGQVPVRQLQERSKIEAAQFLPT